MSKSLERRLDKLCIKWRKLLRLQDWRVEVSVCRFDEMTQYNDSGNCSWNLDLKAAQIRIIHPEDYPQDAFEDQDIEQILVHELIH